MNVALAVIALVSCAASLAAWGTSVRHSRRVSGLREDVDARLRATETARERGPKWLADVREDLEDLRFKADRALREARSREATATHAVRRARSELRESGAPDDERLESIGEELDLFDDDGSENGGVLPMREDVGRAPAEAPRGPEAGPEENWLNLARRRKFGA